LKDTGGNHNTVRLFGLIGNPLTHSFSKKYFDDKFRQEGLQQCRYELFQLAAITELPALLQEYPNLEGLNVTIPYKKEVLRFLDNMENIPPGLEACNCIKREEGKLTGYNTDITGFEKSIDPLLKPYHRRALILGNGGSANAVAFVLKKLGIDHHIVGRTIHDGATLTYKQLNTEIVTNSKLIINTTPLGLYPDTGTFPDIPYQYISPEHLLFDLIYNPAETEFLKKGKEQGAVVKNGEEMLGIQAEESWSRWNA
jgi:shikimate dehydrogenase